MKKIHWKLLLDLMMLVTLTLMYQARVISMSFHEIGGLALIGVFLIHVLLNYKWVGAVTKKLFSHTLPARTRAGYLVNVLLVIAFALIGISGIFISKTLFSFHGGNGWKTIHYSAAAAALILMGFHLALHWRMILGVARKMLRIPAKVGRPLGIVLAAAIFLWGAYNITSTSFLRWLAMPWSSQDSRGGGEAHGGPGQGFNITAAGTEDAASAAATGSETLQEGQTGAQTQDASGQTADSAASGSAATEQQGRGKGGQRPEGIQDGGPGGTSSLSNVLLVISQYASIPGAIAIAAYMLGKLFSMLFKKKPRPALEQE